MSYLFSSCEKCEDRTSFVFITTVVEIKQLSLSEKNLMNFNIYFHASFSYFSGYLKACLFFSFPFVKGQERHTRGTKLKLQTQLPIPSMSLGFSLSDSGIPSQPIKEWLN